MVKWFEIRNLRKLGFDCLLYARRCARHRMALSVGRRTCEEDCSWKVFQPCLIVELVASWSTSLLRVVTELIRSVTPFPFI